MNTYCTCEQPLPAFTTVNGVREEACGDCGLPIAPTHKVCCDDCRRMMQDFAGSTKLGGVYTTCANQSCPCHSSEKEVWTEWTDKEESPTPKKTLLEDCSGCTDPRSEGTHQMHTKQHPCEEGGDPNCGYCTPAPTKAGWLDEYWNHHARCIGTDAEYTDREMCEMLSNALKNNHEWNITFITRKLEEARADERGREIKGLRALVENLNDKYGRGGCGAIYDDISDYIERLNQARKNPL